MHARRDVIISGGLCMRRTEQICPAESATLLLVDDHALRRAALGRMLEQWAREEELPLAFTSAAMPQDAASPERVRIALLSIGETPFGMPDVRLAMECLAQTMPAAAVVVLSERSSTADAAAALRAGACGIVAMRAEPALVLGTLKFILGGGTCFPPEALLATAEVTSAAADAATRGGSAEAGYGKAAMTEGQADVLRLLRRGLSNKQIARALTLSEATVKIHVRQIMRKLGAANRTQVALRAR